MKNTFGNNISLTLFGESHGPAIGAVLDGLAPGIPVSEEEIAAALLRRRPSGAISTARKETDAFSILSGVYNGYTTGTPLCITVPNTAQHSADYGKNCGIARPGPADFAAYCKYHGFEDARGGGHFSGRITAALVAAGSILLSALKQKGVRIGTHISRCAGIDDRTLRDAEADLAALSKTNFPVLSKEAAEKMQAAIEAAAAEGDSVGGVLETVILGLPSGLGEPWFDSVEGLLSHALFSIPAVKGVSFGAGFALADLRGSEANDPFCATEYGVKTETNRNGGINGGITNGMPVVIHTAVKPTPSIYKEQKTVDFINHRDTVLQLQGRHDPCIVHRAAVVADCVCALVVADLLVGRFGTDYLRAEQ